MAFPTGWLYYAPITISNGTADYQTKVTVYEGSGTNGTNIVYCGGHCKSDFSDLRFTGSDFVTLLDYWIESLTGTTPNQVAVVHVQNDSTPSTTGRMYYGNPDATAVSNGANTFNFFDSFGVVKKAAGNPIISPGTDNTYHDYRGCREPRIYKDGSTYYLHYDGCGQATTDPLWTLCRAHATSLEGSWTKDGRILNVGDRKLLGHDDTTPTGANGINTILWTKYTALSSGSMISFNVKCSGSGNVKVGIYSDNGSGTAPVNRLAYTGSTAVVSGWNTISISSVSIVGGTIYWLAFNSDTAVVGYKSETGTRNYIAKDFSYDLPDPATAYGSLTSQPNYQDLVAGWTALVTTPAWDSAYVGTGTIVKSGATYYMFYVGCNSASSDIPSEPYKMGIATASSITGPWTRYGSNPIFQGSGTPGAWDEYWAIITSVIPAPVGSGYTWMAFYTGSTTGHAFKIGAAYSNDLYSWTRYGSNPIVSHTSNIENCEVFQVGSTWYLVVNEINAGGTYTIANRLYKATDATLTLWSYVGNIILPAAGAWDSTAIGVCTTIVEDGIAKMVWDGDDDDDHWDRKIGLQYIYDMEKMNLSDWTNIKGSGVTVDEGCVTVKATTSDIHGIRSTTAFGQGYAMRARVKPAHVNSLSYLEGGRWYNSDNSQFGAYFDHFTASYNGYYYTSQTGNPNITTSLIIGESAAYLILDLIRNASTNEIGKINDADPVTLATNLCTSNAYPDVVAYANNAEITVDWILVRKYTATEPSFAFGSEELVGEQYTRSGTASLGLLGAMSKTGHYQRTKTGLLGLLGAKARVVYLQRQYNSPASLGLKGTYTRVAHHTRANTALVGLKGAATRIAKHVRAYTGLLGLKATAVASFVGSYVKEGIALLGLSGAGTRVLHLTRSKIGLLGLVGLKALTKKITRSYSGLLGLVTTGTNSLGGNLVRVATALLGLVGTGTRTMAVTRTKTAVLGLVATGTRISGTIGRVLHIKALVTQYRKIKVLLLGE